MFYDQLAMKGQQIERIYVGSTFCSQYFSQQTKYDFVLNFCQQHNIKVTLTLPVFTEKDLVLGKKKVEKLLDKGQEVVDEVTINDIGMLTYMQSKVKVRINLGRLFFKDPRDCRIPNYKEKMVEPVLLSNLENDFWRTFHVNLVELDSTNRVINTSILLKSDIDIGIHYPFCYMSTSNICKFASIHKDIASKFRPNMACNLECEHIIDTYSGHITQTDCDPIIYRLGRTLYYETEVSEFVGKQPSRIIYFPINEWRKCCNGNIGTIK